ncbi:MAG TPA: FdtA/QdtA family cupin domain-containing protein [Candidatus Saccharimonadales bacterium]|nr:FdtA/QdtA family cupin domain-containing protein [Candidatus Saccharimonadales bacterium]
MAKIIKVRTYSVNRNGGEEAKDRGQLSIIEENKDIPFDIKRIYYIYGSKNVERGGHRHKKTKSALICVSGEFKIFVNDGHSKKTFKLNTPEKCLLLNPRDWHTMISKDSKAVLLVLASEFYDVKDYIDKKYENH